MTDIAKLEGVWFVYDGECPICERAAEALVIRQSLGKLHLVDARTTSPHPLLNAINDRRLDLDEGMVIYHDGAFHHGKTALRFMSVYGAPNGLFNHINRLLFRSKGIANTLYPVMRAGRNILLKLRGKSKIRNLLAIDEPIFQPVFGSEWHQLPPVMRSHYANRPYSGDVRIAKGTMKVEAGWFMRLLAPISRFFGGIPTYAQSNIPVEVRFESDPNGGGLTFNRRFDLSNARPYIFKSTMVPLGGNLMVERMQFGLCWRVRFSWHEEQVRLTHSGYALSMFGRFMKVPLDWLLGRIEAYEQVTGDNSFSMAVDIRHPWWGTYYRYSGRFEMLPMKDTIDD